MEEFSLSRRRTRQGVGPHPSQHNGGWIEVICGGMFSGKTEELIRRLKRAEIARQGIQAFKPRLDNRYSDTEVASHAGTSYTALPVENSKEIESRIKPDTTVIAIDEAQFFDNGILEVCSNLADQGLRVIVAGLDLDFRGEPFGPIPFLMAEAELVDKLQAICLVCGAPASRTLRLVNGKPAAYDDPIILIGAQESYEARCREHRKVPRSGS